MLFRSLIISIGEVPEWLNGLVSKTSMGLTVHRGFESLPLRHFIFQAFGRFAFTEMAEGEGFEPPRPLRA